jgi:two-component system sensor histidine kinase/response regulator
MNFDVTAAASSSEALDLLSSVDSTAPVALVLIDWRRKGEIGPDLLHRIGALGLAHAPERLIVTDHNRDEIAGAPETADARAVLMKPVSRQTLFDSLNRALAPNAAASPAPSAPRDTLVDATVLLVEDNEINRQIASEILESAGMIVDIAVNGRVALGMLDARHYDLVLMDIHMSEMDGFEATAALRRDARFTSLPIIAMTANVMQHDRDTCIRAGMNDHVATPISPDILLGALRKWLPAPPVERLRRIQAKAAEGPWPDDAPAKPTTRPDIVVIDPETARRRRERLDALLVGADAEAVEFLEAHQAFLRGFFVKDFASFEQCVKDYDFDAALQILRDCETRAQSVPSP